MQRVWGSGIANKMGASQETFLWVKITQDSFQIIKWYVPKKKVSYMIYLKAYVVKLERNYIGILGSGGDSPPKASDISKNQIKWKPDIYFLKRKLHFLRSFFSKMQHKILLILSIPGVQYSYTTYTDI